jgi:four helix bundle protein
MGFIYSFEKLEVWQLSRKLVKEIYSVTEQFPTSEKFGLVTQLRRASISVSSNLAEGSSRKSSKEQAYFTQMAFTSLMEILNQLILSVDLGFLSEERLSTIRPEIELIGNKLNAFRNSQLNKQINK